MPKYQAFTLIELMIVISILAILMAATIPTFNSYNKGQIFSQDVRNVQNDLRTIQNFSLSGVAGRSWGIQYQLNGNSYVIYNINYDPTATTYQYSGCNINICTTVKTVNLSNNTLISALSPINAANTLDVVFENETGKIFVNQGNAAAAITLDYAAGSSHPDNICLSAGGSIYEKSNCP